MPWDFASNCRALQNVQEGTVLAVTGNSTADDMRTCRNLLVLVDLNVTTDTITNLLLEHSADNVTFTTHSTLAAALAVDGFTTYSVQNVRRYVRVSWTRVGAGADTTWGVYFVGDLAVYDAG